MKAVFVVLFLALTNIASANQILPTIGRPSEKILNTHLDQGALDKRMFINHTFVGADLELNLTRQEAILTITPDCENCRTLPFTVKLPIVSAQKETCGSIIYTAETQNAPIGGQFSTLTIIDNSENTCMHFNVLPNTEVRYTVTQPVYPAEGFESTFTGDVLSFDYKVF